MMLPQRWVFSGPTVVLRKELEKVFYGEEKVIKNTSTYSVYNFELMWEAL